MVTLTPSMFLAICECYAASWISRDLRDTARQNAQETRTRCAAILPLENQQFESLLEDFTELLELRTQLREELDLIEQWQFVEDRNHQLTELLWLDQRCDRLREQLVKFATPIEIQSSTVESD